MEQKFTQFMPLLSRSMFVFNPDFLSFSGTEWSFCVRYHDVPNMSLYKGTRIRPRYTKFFVFYLLILSFFILIRNPYSFSGVHNPYWTLYVAGAIFSVAIAFCYFAYYVLEKDCTVIPTANGKLFIVRDRQHDAIVGLLQTKRLEALRRLSSPDPANSPAEETAKLAMLRREGAITDQEFVALVAAQGSSTVPDAA